ncbi:MAG: sigma-70 family RNA polymerase sigma factor [Anaerolineae bacterium]|nr:sigma-70 family RNA polymerase sigma factor [Anaerolineae bacterium]
MDSGEELLRRAQNWDESALAEIYDTFGPPIHRYIYRKTGNLDAAQDLTSETFHRFLLALKRGGGPREHLSGWLYRVAHNLIVDYYRDQPDVPHAALDDADPSRPATQDEHVARKDRASRARAALLALTPLQRQVISLRYLEEMSLKDTAAVLGRTVGSIKALQHRAIDSLQRLLEEDDEA